MKHKIPMDRVYVKVNSDFDATGYVQPRTITWPDGRVFRIETVRDYCPIGMGAACYTIIVRGKIKYLFFEKAERRDSGSIGRWYVERIRCG